MSSSILSAFSALLERDDLPAYLREGLIGNDATVEGPFGPKPLVYADYVASGRAFRQIESFLLEHVLPYYSNSHTDASFCGSFCTQARHAARQYIADELGATDDYSVLFTGAGATAGINRLVSLLAIAQHVREGKDVVVLIGPYEHHSNLLPWRESGATIIELSEATNGGPALDELERLLRAHRDADQLIGAFSAASNVTGIVTDVDAVSRLLNRFGAISVWDYACGAPYLPMSVNAGLDTARDVIVYSSHKFPGGPAASGVMIMRNAIVGRSIPTWPGGGTVSYVSPWNHVYSDSLINREEAGTPNMIGDIRAALVLMIKQALGTQWLESRQACLREQALAVWRNNPLIEMMGTCKADHYLPIFSFRVRDVADANGGYLHHQLFTRLLSDVHGIQARGGCACAGSYAHRLLGLDELQAGQLQKSLLAGLETDKPGWIRLNLSALMSDETVDHVITSVNQLTTSVDRYRHHYRLDGSTARFESVATPLIDTVANADSTTVSTVACTISADKLRPDQDWR